MGDMEGECIESQGEVEERRCVKKKRKKTRCIPT